ncbi:hypothetical protein [Thomasclavelia sp.]|uniref:hypothetical protein n=1 Tax=Thomasclavelia sp. TaxID=3025757 RepID=UPI0025F8C267|nr:hypothetical protein [Thomasclavelia sp.]
MSNLSSIILVPVIIGCALGGTVGILKVIHKFFPNAKNSVEKTEEWIEKHK